MTTKDTNVKTVSFWPGHPISYTTTRLEVFFQDQFLGFGTGFIIKYAGQYGLVTNWHVLSGRSPIDNKCISKMGGIPNRVLFHIALANRQGNNIETIEFRQMDIKLFSDECNQNKIWHDNRDIDKNSDYAIIRIDNKIVNELDLENYTIRSIEGGKITLKHGISPNEIVSVSDISYFYPPVGHQIFIVGYPAGITPSGVFPIWKSATIASEPTIGITLGDFETDDVILVDGLTRSGMSGSPVVCLPKVGERFFTGDGIFVETAKDKQPFLVGVYAGREGVTTNEADLALGRVWKVAAIERLFSKIIAEGRRPI